MDHNLDVYNQFAHEYGDYRLYPPERAILQKFKAQWSSVRMLDVGIGTGRTTYTFSAIVGTYVGIDYSEEMLRRCRSVVPENNNVSFLRCDARDLSRFYSQPFDFVMFSLNGLDSVGHEDRTRILAEVRKVLAPDGYFFFSTHSLPCFSFTRALPVFRLSAPVRSVYHLMQALRFNARLRWAYKGLQQDEVRKRDWAILKTGDHDFKIDIYHVDPGYQLRELTRLGFRVDAVLDPEGRSVDAASNTAADWLYFLCRPETAVASPVMPLSAA